MAFTDYNHITITGRLTADPKLDYTPTGTAVCNFKIANNYYNGKKENGTSFIFCVAFANMAETVAKYFVKGQKILLGGELRINQFTGKDEKKHEIAKIYVSNFQFMDSKKSDGYTQEEKAMNAPMSDEQVSSGFGGAAVLDDEDVPF